MNDLPTLLLLEDDPPSRQFLTVALCAMPVRVDAVGSLAQARAAIAATEHALWLFDARLPDGESADLLAALRAARHQTPAIALTADPQPARRRALLAAGFAEVLIKPLGAAALHAAVRSQLPTRVPLEVFASGWDEAHALAAAGGVARTRDALRELFIAELPTLRERIMACVTASDTAGAGALLHRLQGSCAFVGATPLLQASQRLSAAPHDAANRADFAHQCERLLLQR